MFAIQLAAVYCCCTLETCGRKSTLLCYWRSRSFTSSHVVVVLRWFPWFCHAPFKANQGRAWTWDERETLRIPCPLCV